MNIWRIAVKEMLVSRDVKMLLFMLATPVLLMLILGTVLSNAFSGSQAAGDIRVLYISESGVTADELAAQAEAKGVILEQASSGMEESLREVQDGSYTGFMMIKEAGIHYYGNSRSKLENGIVNGLLTGIAERSKLEATLTELPNEGGAAAAAGGNAGLVKETLLEGSPRPGAMDYFAIAVTTMSIFYYAATAGQLIDNERVRNTAARLLAAPVSKYEIFTGKVIGNVVLNTLFVAVVVFISKYMYDANWGSNMGLVFLVLISLIVFTISMGLAISYLIKGKAAGAVIMIIIQLACLFGGSYFQVVDNGDFISVMSRYSPLTWSNEALVGIIYGNDSGELFAASEAILLNIGISAALLAASIFIMRRREGL
ncbi:ABC transporter permease [Paenibacillus nanensis]|uniref:ABC transporter permease n=1 Tax=Paenibacillus nanensis TaxID=393251 RepID=A0A3A1USF4_9BACL|nr:ABC transporter permease [Paenibacillus nanensis]RIX51479.1 ABC transporter permease [Paenibacillus nanensis]